MSDDAMTPRCIIDIDRHAKYRVRWTHEGRKRVALLCAECFIKCADLLDSATDLNAPPGEGEVELPLRVETNEPGRKGAYARRLG